MKIQPKTLNDGRVIFCITEDDGTPFHTLNIAKDTFASVVSEWINIVLDEEKSQFIMLADGEVEILIARRPVQQPQEKEQE